MIYYLTKKNICEKKKKSKQEKASEKKKAVLRRINQEQAEKKRDFFSNLLALSAVNSENYCRCFWQTKKNMVDLKTLKKNSKVAFSFNDLK